MEKFIKRDGKFYLKSKPSIRVYFAKKKEPKTVAKKKTTAKKPKK